MRKLLIFWLLICCSAYVSNAQTAKYSNEFLSIGVGAKSLGMANSTVAHVGDVSSGYWNPAGMLNVEQDFEIGAMHAEYFAGVAKYDYLGGVMAIDSNQRLGASMIRFGVDNIPNTTELIDNEGNIDYDRISYFTAADYAFLVSYAKKTAVDGLWIGGNAKVIYRNVGQFANAYGFGFDLSAQYHKDKWSFGAVLRDATTTFNAWTYNEDELEIEVQDSLFNQAPDNNIELTMPKILLGAARHFRIYEDFHGLVEVDADIFTDGMRHSLISSEIFSIDPHIGMQFRYKDLAYLRMGVGNFQMIENIDRNEELSFQPNLGVGFHYEGFSIDYALTDIGDQSVALYSNIFTLRYAFSAGNN
ncbi:MAG: PorV/PorQ family protein [Bacteroidota bacterium]